MARPAEFDRAEVLQNALDLFRHRGYSATSINALVTATGLKPGSLYGAFNSKRDLFKEALDLYARHRLDWVRNCLDTAEPPLTAIHRFFREFRQKLRRDEAGQGGLLTKTLLELGPLDEEIRHHIGTHLGHLQREFQQALDRARAAGELPADTDTARQAHFIMASVAGLWSFNSQGVAPEVYDLVIDQVLTALAPGHDWPPLDGNP